MEFAKGLVITAFALLDAPDQVAQQALNRFLIGKGSTGAGLGVALLPTWFRSHPVPLRSDALFDGPLGRGVGLVPTRHRTGANHRGKSG